VWFLVFHAPLACDAVNRAPYAVNRAPYHHGSTPTVLLARTGPRSRSVIADWKSLCRVPVDEYDISLDDLYDGVREHWGFCAETAAELLARVAKPGRAEHARAYVLQAFGGGCQSPPGARVHLSTTDFDLDKVKAMSFQEATVMQQLLVAAHGTGQIFNPWFLGLDAGSDPMRELLAIAHRIRKSAIIGRPLGTLSPTAPTLLLRCRSREGWLAYLVAHRIIDRAERAEGG
jgi:hypothetical protein